MKGVYRDDPQTYWQRREATLQQRLAQAQEEGRVKDECLALATEGLKTYANTFTGAPGYALSILNRIKQLLAQLEPEEETG